MYINAEEQINGSHFRGLCIDNVKLKIGHKDSCFKTSEGNIYVLVNIVKRNDSIFLIIQQISSSGRLLHLSTFFLKIRHIKSSNLDNVRHVLSVENVEAKCWLMPDGLQFFLCSFVAYYAVIAMIQLFV